MLDGLPQQKSQNSLEYKSVTLDLQNREDVAQSRVSFGNSIVLALRSAIIKNRNSDEVLRGHLTRIRACALRSNHWVAEDLHNEKTGELYAGNGTNWSCNSKLCPSCVAKASNRSRRELSLALENQKLRTGESYKFITLTIVNPNLSLLETRAMVDRAYSLFRKRKFFIEKIRGGSKNEEFTVTNNGYHYHIHLLCVTRFLSYEKLRSEWTECVKIAFAENDLSLKVTNKDGLLSVNVQKVASSKNGLKGAIQEVCKYITKSDSWEKLPEKDLIEIASISRFPRMFELFGFFRDQRSANMFVRFRQPIITYLLINFFLQVLNKITEIIKISDDDTILDTKQISDGIKSCLDEFSGNSPPELKLKRERRMNWRKHIEQFGLDSYVERLTEDIESVWEYRKSALKLKYPFASFRTLDGETF